MTRFEGGTGSPEGPVDGAHRQSGWPAAIGVLVLSLTACSLPRWPVDAPLSSPYGLRLDGFLPEVHRGVDLAVPTGTPVHAMADGVVEVAGRKGAYGLVVLVRHHQHLASVYAHLSELRVQAGAHVTNGQLIALSGASGNATGPHLHFEVIRWNRAEDPVPLLGGPPRAAR